MDITCFFEHVCRINWNGFVKRVYKSEIEVQNVREFMCASFSIQLKYVYFYSY